MKLFGSAYAVGALVGLAAAYPHLDPNYEQNLLDKRQDLGKFPYQYNPPGCVRSPCPGHNTLANHGFIARSGKGLTKADIQNGFLQAFGMGFAVTQPGVDNTFALCKSVTGSDCATFNLDLLSTPHQIEHDASLSRRDKQMFHDQNANNHEFNQTIWNRSLMIYGGTPRIGTKFANTARVVRVQQAQQADFPGWFQENVGGSLAEHAFILSAMNDPAAGVNLATPGANPQARMDWINFWFTRQQLPTPLGWKTPTQVITGNQIASLANAIQNAGTVTANPGQSPFVQKRSLDEGAAPSPSYNLEVEERAVPAAAVPSLIANPGTASQVQVAQARASQQVGPPPSQPNPYFDTITADDWTAIRKANAAYSAKFQAAFSQNLADLGINVPPSS